ncbi:MAG: type I methionyl aminopeptidase [Deltaproteobacteria bacterium]|nr:type I methionyl aminopeptidase [Deltaproteobacteria bacterium]
MSGVPIKSAREVALMRQACQVAAETLLGVGEMLRPGVTTAQIDRFVREDTARRGARPAQLNYHGFPRSVCTSVNEVVCHGIPGPRVLDRGDIINVDITSVVQGYHGDTSATFYIGEPGPDAKHVTEVARQCLEVGIRQVREGIRIGDIGAAIQRFAESQGCSVVKAFVGHGVGRAFHEAPQVPHYGRPGTLSRLRAGMCITIEPMINLGNYDVEILEDRWTAVTKDRTLSAQFEHTVVVTKNGCEVLTRRSRPLANSEIFPRVFN